MSPENKEKKKRGKRENPGESRAHILLMLAKNPGEKYTNISKHFRDNLGIHTRKPIDDQFKIIETEKVVSRKPVIEIGDDHCRISRSINKTFHAFKYTYDLLKKQGLLNEFMSSLYYDEYIDTDDFKVKFAFNIFKTNLLAVNEIIKSPQDCNKLIKAIKGKPLFKYTEPQPDLEARDKEYRQTLLDFLDKLKNNDTSDVMVNTYHTLTADLSGPNIDEQLDTIIARIKLEKELGTRAGLTLDSLLSYILGELLPEHEWANISKMLKVSPRAIEFAINPVYPDANISASIASLIFNKRIDPVLFTATLDHDITNMESQNMSPACNIIKSYFIIDNTENKLIKKDNFNEIMDGLMTQKMTTKILTRDGKIEILADEAVAKLKTEQK